MCRDFRTCMFRLVASSVDGGEEETHMSAPVRQERPHIDDTIVRRWPTPPGFRRSAWRSMSPEDREAYLIDHTYAATPTGWVRRAESSESATADKVERAVTVSEGTEDLVIQPIVEAMDQTMEMDDETGFRQRTSGFYVGLVIALLAVAILVLAALATDLFGEEDTTTPDAPTPTGATGEDADATASDTDGDAGEPAADVDGTLVDLTDGTWRFFLDDSETAALYDFAFAADGTFVEHGAAHNHGTYDVHGDLVTLDLTRAQTRTADDGRSADLTWNETFTMTRTDNTMTGTWIKDNWRFSFEEGFVELGQFEPQSGIFARPERPEDVG